MAESPPLCKPGGLANGGYVVDDNNLWLPSGGEARQCPARLANVDEPSLSGFR